MKLRWPPKFEAVSGRCGVGGCETRIGWAWVGPSSGASNIEAGYTTLMERGPQRLVNGFRALLELVHWRVVGHIPVPAT
jgi:hypothetical protein